MFPSTLLPQDNSREEIRKATLDLLKKINQLSDMVDAINDSVVFTTGDQSIDGQKTFKKKIIGDISGNSETVTNGVYTTGAQTIAGEKTLSSIVYPTAGIFGLLGSSSPAPGLIGERIAVKVAPASAVSLTSGTAVNLGSITLPAGVWRIDAEIYVNCASTTNMTRFIGGFSNVSAVLPTGSGVCQQSSNTCFDEAWTNGMVGVRTSRKVGGFDIRTGTGTIYFVVQANFTVSTATAAGSLVATRIA